jgi:DNA (cytosine-5)-methyltransferase 1
MNWLNLCSGGEIGRQAVKELGLPVTNWYSFEVDKFAIKVAMDNHDDVVQLGDIKNYWKWADNFSANGKDLSASIDVILCGSPCQGFSVAGKGLNFEHPQSKLFFEFVNIYRTIYQANPNVKLLFENVRMKKEWQNIIVSTLQEINPKLKMYMINSSLVSAQNRVRMYITDFEFDIPEDRNIKLKDIIECGCVDREKSYCLDANYWKGGNLRTYFEKSRRQLVFKNHNIEKSDTNCIQVGVADLNGHDILKRVYSVEGKSPTLNTCGGGNREPKILCKSASVKGRRIDQDGVRKDNDKSIPLVQTLEVYDNDKSRCLSTVDKDAVVSPLPVGRYPHAYTNSALQWRKLTVRECCRLQTLPDDYCKSVSNSQGYKILGNGWTNEVIKFILKGKS